MAHWAQLDENNIVINITVGNNDDLDEGYQWLIDNVGGTWVKTSYNTYGGIHMNDGVPLRKNFAGIGYFYDENRDAFIPPKPFNSWNLDEETCWWIAPVGIPDYENEYEWDENILNWKKVN